MEINSQEKERPLLMLPQEKKFPNLHQCQMLTYIFFYVFCPFNRREMRQTTVPLKLVTIQSVFTFQQQLPVCWEVTYRTDWRTIYFLSPVLTFPPFIFFSSDFLELESLHVFPWEKKVCAGNSTSLDQKLFRQLFFGESSLTIRSP